MNNGIIIYIKIKSKKNNIHKKHFNISHTFIGIAYIIN